MIFVPVVKSFYVMLFGFRIDIYTYFLMSLLGYIFALIFLLYEARRKKLKSKKAIGAFIAAFLGISVGSRFFFYFVPWWSYDRTWTLAERFMRFINVFSYPGMVMYGGIIGGMIAVWIYFKMRKLDFWRYLDAFAPAMFVGYAIGRLGCFLVNDTCRGISTSLPWGVVREIGQPAIHPAPIYSTIVALIIFAVLWHIKEQKHFDGWLALIGTMAYSSTRFVIEFFRSYTIKLFGFITPSHIISVIIFFLALWIFIKKSKEEKRIKPKERKSRK
jgi:prolipoprotein diacylglyceryl transferase